ncbi:hypothetical protein SAZ11_16655 [Streptomyces sp. FXJ1.4098]|nr:hypothetical protein [Streptomyces sp. FXJ1.4098]
MPVSAVPLPGFAPDERLPETSEAAVSVAAECVRKAADGDPFVLLGYSSGERWPTPWPAVWRRNTRSGPPRSS